MPIEEVAESLIKFLGRLLLYFFLEIIIELLIKGPGYFLTKIFLKNKPDIDGWITILFGLLFWVVVGGLVYFVYINNWSDQT